MSAEPIAPGVVRRQDGRHAIYTGTADRLVAAGLVQTEQLPGQPGNARGLCTYDADGDQVRRGKGRGRGRDAGSMRIIAKSAKSGSHFEVWLLLSLARVEAIEAEAVRASTCWPFPVVHLASWAVACAGGTERHA